MPALPATKKSGLFICYSKNLLHLCSAKYKIEGATRVLPVWAFFVSIHFILYSFLIIFLHLPIKKEIK